MSSQSTQPKWHSDAISAGSQQNRCNLNCRKTPKLRFRPEPSVPYEPMFDSRRQLKERLLDAVDLVIDFATLGEYGLEPVPEAPACRRAACPGTSQTARSAPRRPTPAGIS